MYKITLWDENIGSCASGVVSVFVDSLDYFEINWIPLTLKRRNNDGVDRYYRSKHGEIVTDYYSDAEELNIVQKDSNSKIHRNHKYTRHNTWLHLLNGYDCEYKLYVKDITFFIRYIQFNGKYYKVAKYEASGVCTEFAGLHEVNVYGNPFVNVRKYDIRDYRIKDGKHKKYTKEDFADDKLQCFVWNVLKEYDNYEDMLEDANKRARLSKEEIIWLMADIPGDAG